MTQEKKETYQGSDTTTHQAGVAKGEEQSDGDDSDGLTMRDATSINPEDRAPIDEDMPVLPPA